MKKKYEKPLIAVENYMLSQTIADCGTKIGFQNSACVEDDADAPNGFRNLASSGYFAEGFCSFSPDISDQRDGICYHTQASALFTS